MLSLQSRSASHFNAQRSVGSLRRRRLDAVLDYMAAHYARQLTLDELAREVHVSRFHFVQIFRREVGVTPYQHLIALRLGAATRILLRTDSSVHAIAQACGYATGAHFAKAFGKRYGLTPSAYRTRATVASSRQTWRRCASKFRYERLPLDVGRTATSRRSGRLADHPNA